MWIEDETLFSSRLGDSGSASMTVVVVMGKVELGLMAKKKLPTVLFGSPSLLGHDIVGLVINQRAADDLLIGRASMRIVCKLFFLGEVGASSPCDRSDTKSTRLEKAMQWMASVQGAEKAGM